MSTEPSGIRLRQAEAGDAQAIGAVFDAAVRDGWAYMGEIASRPMFTAADWEKDVADHAPPNLMLVATNGDGRIVGFTAVHPQDCEMYLLFVDPASAGRGVGRMLLSAADGALRRAGCAEAFLYTHEQNDRALHVYASAGYRPDGSIRESEFRGMHLRELRLVKRL